MLTLSRKSFEPTRNARHIGTLLALATLLLFSCYCEAVSYKLPYTCGKSYTVTQGNNSAPSHKGVALYAFDFGMPEGHQVVAAAAGTVKIVVDRFTEGGDDWDNLRNKANRIVIEHADGYCTLYLHLQPNSAVVKEGQWVSQGQPIARSGRTGYVLGENGAHLHFQLQRRGIWWEQTVPVTFDDVPGGMPVVGGSYASGNCLTVRTATVLVMDVSGSMASSWQGERRIESAKKAALQYIEQVSNEPRSPGTIHEIAVVTFSGNAALVLQLTSSYSQARNAIIQLGTVSSTNIGAGLSTALRELDRVPTAERFIILLSDGASNTGLSDSQILSGPVAEARRKDICIHTVGFGSSGSIDEAFLKDIASRSGCGTYNYASSGFGLFGTYIKIRHSTLGGEQIVDFTSQNQSVITLPNSPITIGAFYLRGQVRELHYTFAWSDAGRMSAKLVDPSGKTVTFAYPGATFYYGSQFAHVTVISPPAGVWRVSAVPLQRFPASVQYYGVVSSRPGGVFPFHLPLICIGDWCIPYPDLPTSLIVLISVAALAYLIYEQLQSL